MNKVELILKEIERLEKENCMNNGEHFCMRRAICLGRLRQIISPIQQEPSKVWHDASEEPMVDKTFLLVSPNGNSSLCLWGGKELLSVTLGGGHSVLCKGDKWAYLDDIINLQEEPVSNPTPNEKMSVERWKKACEAACCDRNYRSHYGLTETRDDYFVDGVQWADEHPYIKPVSEDLEKAAVEIL